MAGAFDHDLDIMLPGDLGQLAQRLQLSELRLVIGVPRSSPGAARRPARQATS